MTLSNDCDPAGDLVLKLGSGDEVTLIRVQSKVLGLASPVFAAMLSPRFVEGQNLEDNKKMVDATTTIDLPNDDPASMSLLCKILHFKKDAAQRPFYPPDILIGLAVICDKYNMSRALSPWSYVWMDMCHKEDQYDLFDTARISYGLEHHESFWKSTRDILRHSTLAELNTEHSLLPDNIIGPLRVHCKKLLDQLQSNLESLIIPLVQCDCRTEEHQGGVESCEHLIMLGIYVKCLSRRELWPVSNIQTHSISEVSFAFDSFPNLKYRSAGQRMMGGTACSTPQEEKLKRLLDKALAGVDRGLRGLCLSCVKYGTSTKEDGNCHADLECHYLVKTEHETG